MADFLAVLSEAHRDNWEICKREQLWGTSHSGVGASHAQQVGDGDRMFVWTAAHGLTAMATITGPARAVGSSSEVPWPDPERYGFTFPIRVVAELDEAYADEFTEGQGGNRTSDRLGLKGWQLQSGFAALDERQGAACAAVFHIAGPVAPPESTVPVHRDPVSAVFLTAESVVESALLTLYRQRERCTEGELLIVGDEQRRAEVLAELEREPFDQMRSCVRFVTRDELAEELRARLA